MHEFHAWIGLAESTVEDDDSALRSAVNEIERLVAEPVWPAARFEVLNLNGRYFFSASGYVNRRRGEGGFLDELLGMIVALLPASWGLVYDRDDEMPEPVGPNRFRVRIVARGVITEAADPFLSPCRPVIED
jgi:hypothetical protein